MSNLKLCVEVVSAHNLLSKDGKGSSSAFVELQFDNQKFRTTIKEKDLDPHWNETFYFQISDPNILSNLVLEVCIYHYVSATRSKSCLGKVKISGTSFVPYSDAVVMHFPLEKSNFLSRVRGELGLKIFITDCRYVNTQTNMYTSMNQEYSLQAPDSDPNTVSVKEKNSISTFPHLPYKNYPPQPMNPQDIYYRASEMRTEYLAPKVVQMYSGSSSQPVGFSFGKTSPILGGGQVDGRAIHAYRPTLPSMYDLVEPMHYLFVRVVKARKLPSIDMTGSLDPYVKVIVGNYKGTTKYFEKNQKPEWNTVFAFSKEKMQSSELEIVVKDKDKLKDDFVGILRFDLNEVPTRVPPDSPLAPEWYMLEDKNGVREKGEIMVSVWMGTQADEAFPDALHSDAASHGYSSSNNFHICSKVYQSPRLWYLRVNVIEVQDLVLSETTRFPNVYVKAQIGSPIGSQVTTTKSVQFQTRNAFWNEDLMFVAAEPLDDYLVLTVENWVGRDKEETLGKLTISLNSIEKRLDNLMVRCLWFSLQKPSSKEVDYTLKEDKDKFASKIRLRLSLDGGYHVLDESIQYSSDLRPTAKQLWKAPIGVLELGILNADGISPMKTRDKRQTSGIYCVAKYGHKWVRTRTVINSQDPKFNEQYTWEVYDTATVLTIGVFDNSHVGNKGENGSHDTKIGKVEIRISTLGTGRVYKHTYPLLTLHPSGVKKMAELHLAIRFSCTSFTNMMYMYSRPLLPKMHYVRPLAETQLNNLRHQARSIVAARLSRAEPPLKMEVVDDMYDAHSHLFSMRRSKANLVRLKSVFNGLVSFGKWFREVCMWKNTVTTVLVHVLFSMLVCFPKLILPTLFIYVFVIGLLNFRFRPKYPSHMNTGISHADSIDPDELDEELDTFSISNRSPDLIRRRYDRLRIIVGKIQTVMGDVATQGERVQSLLSWQDSRATTIFLVFCLVAATVLYATPFQLLIVIAGFYAMRHPKFRNKLPPGPVNFFRRLPAKNDTML